MADELHFEPSPFRSKRPFPIPKSTVQTTVKPGDDLTAAPVLPDTIFYLCVIVPHTDTYRIHGPAKSFQHILPQIEAIVSNSPSAIDKLDALRTTEDIWGSPVPNEEFPERGFNTFVVEGQRGTFTILKVEREIRPDVYECLPSPVFVLTASGPLGHNALRADDARGYARTTRLIGSFVERRDAKKRAEEVMREMTAGQSGVSVSENWDKKSGGGMIVAMNGRQSWEVRIGYENQVLKRAREGLDREGESVGWRF